jgi:hypothetical protein
MKMDSHGKERLYDRCRGSEPRQPTLNFAKRETLFHDDRFAFPIQLASVVGLHVIKFV